MQNSNPSLNKPTDTNATILGTVGNVKKSDDNIYFPLDAILDTRLGTLGKLGSNYAANVLKTGTYHKRMTDIFEGISKEEYRQAYAKRDIETLKYSVVTNLVFFLRRIIKDSLMSAVVNQKVENLCFTVNVYPYVIEDETLIEMLINCIRFHTYSTSSVKIVSISDEALTPEFCCDNFQIMVMYDWVNWLDKHRTYFQTQSMSQVALVVPEMFYDEAPTEADIDRLNMRQNNPFRMNEELSAAMFRLKYMPASLFSMHEGITAKNAKEVVQRAQITQADIETYLNKSYPKAELIPDTPLPTVSLEEAFNLL